MREPALRKGQGRWLALFGGTAEARKHLEDAVRLARPDDPRPRAALDRLVGP
jgi:hypothetical protein